MFCKDMLNNIKITFILDNYMEQYIIMLFVPIGILSGGISILEKNYMFGIDNSVDKFSEKYDVNIDKTIYCRFEGIQRVKTATGLLILDIVFFLFEIRNAVPTNSRIGTI